jgi:DNA polymerase III alpha subunit (gram-positive type)
MNEEDLKKLSESRSEISKKSWDISEEEYKEKCKRISEGLKNSDFDFKDQLKSYWDNLGQEERTKINKKRNSSNSEFWKNMSEEDYKKRCENISSGKSCINQSEVSSEFWKNMSSKRREEHSKNVSIGKKMHYKKINDLKNKEILSEDERLILKNEENRIKLASQKLKSIFEVKNNITGEEFIIVSVDELCKLVGVSKFMYKYNLSKKNCIINNYEFKKIK